MESDNASARDSFRLLLLRLRPFLHLDAILTCDDADVHHIHEEAVVNNTLEGKDRFAGSMAVLDGFLLKN